MSDMLRNMSETLPDGSLISGTEYVGLKGEDILSSAFGGDHGAGIMAAFDLESGRRYRLRVTSSSFETGTLFVNENGSGRALSSGTFTFDFFDEDSPVPSPRATRTVSISIGDDLGPLGDAEMRVLSMRLSELHLIHGLQVGSPLLVTSVSRSAGGIMQGLAVNAGGSTTTATRL